ncbi:MAG TPA: hypothetical protein ENH28_00230 [Euryarchaeota archaeon]|nr:hypothetical protein BMS3Bbin15_00507 [archaeon BMS3Bbin15]HDL14581.1 hypothetical protein [Euryarchaeota archaeon]
MHIDKLYLGSIKCFLGEEALEAKLRNGSAIERATTKVILALKDERCPQCGKKAVIVENSNGVIVLCESCEGDRE